jgi:hypothetical protein
MNEQEKLPVECVTCGQTCGPVVAVGADYPGNLCDACYGKIEREIDGEEVVCSAVEYEEAAASLVGGDEFTGEEKRFIGSLLLNFYEGGNLDFNFDRMNQKIEARVIHNRKSPESPSREWLQRMADGEDACQSVSARSPCSVEVEDTDEAEQYSAWCVDQGGPALSDYQQAELANRFAGVRCVAYSDLAAAMTEAVNQLRELAAVHFNEGQSRVGHKCDAAADRLAAALERRGK